MYHDYIIWYFEESEKNRWNIKFIERYRCKNNAQAIDHAMSESQKYYVQTCNKHYYHIYDMCDCWVTCQGI